jgi:hypothetical protein
MPYIRALAVFFVLGLAACTTTQYVSENPRHLAKRFCNFTQNERSSAPSTLFTPSLVSAINSALVRNDIIAKAHPDEKPPFGDGIPYQAYQDNAPVCSVGKWIGPEADLRLEINHKFPKEPTANWTDHIVLKKIGPEWRIDDILYGNDHTEGLRDALKNAFSSN